MSVDLADLKVKALAAKEQMDNGPQEWPGRPSRQRLELFLAASPEVVLELVALAERKNG
jgi:hypothetical protein